MEILRYHAKISLALSCPPWSFRRVWEEIIYDDHFDGFASLFFFFHANQGQLPGLCDVTVCFKPGCCLLHIRHIILCIPKGAWASAEWYRGEGQGTFREFCNRTWNEVGRLRCTIR